MRVTLMLQLGKSGAKVRLIYILLGSLIYV